MKLLKFTILLCALLLLNCGVSKSVSRFVVYKAQDGQKVPFEKYVQDKIDICKYLALNEQQESSLKALFSEEKTELDKIAPDDQQMLARNIYKYETAFRKTLNSEQLKMYKKMRSQFEDKFFYSQHSLNSIENAIMKI